MALTNGAKAAANPSKRVTETNILNDSDEEEKSPSQVTIKVNADVYN